MCNYETDQTRAKELVALVNKSLHYTSLLLADNDDRVQVQFQASVSDSLLCFSEQRQPTVLSRFGIKRTAVDGWKSVSENVSFVEEINWLTSRRLGVIQAAAQLIKLQRRTQLVCSTGM